MTRINTNVTALTSARILNNNNTDYTTSLKRLSTGLRINSGADDPAGLIASENLRKQIIGTEAAIKNGERAVNIASTAEGALSEVSSMLLDLQGLLSEAANTGGMSEEEIDANQLQVDSIINSINRIANNTQFEGIKLLNGNLNYTTSGVPTAKVSEVNINSAKLIDGAAVTVNIDVTTSAQRGAVFFSGTQNVSGAITIQFGSNKGTTEITFASTTSIANMKTAINNLTEATGVTASASTSGLRLYSVDYGSDAYVSAKILSGNHAAFGLENSATTTEAQDSGQDVAATINGSAATGSGTKLTIRTAMLDAEFDLVAATAADPTSSVTFTITGGGADFALGSMVDANGLESIGIGNMSSSSLGNSTDGYLNTLRSGGDNALSSTNLYTAQRIVNSAIKEVSTLRGRLGSFQKNTLETTLNSLQVTKENLSAAESAIRDTDFATETSNLTRSQILVQSATSVLAQANYAPQNVLSLLG